MIILVDKDDKQIGLASKTEVHKKGLLHRAFSVIIVNTKGEILMQQRALNKYHTPGIWTNTCCSHPKPGETLLEAAKRRLNEEMGMSSKLAYLFKFHYKANFSNGLIENEIDHVFIGTTDVKPNINPNEVNDYKYMSIKELKAKLETKPNDFSVWFQLIFKKLLDENKI